MTKHRFFIPLACAAAVISLCAITFVAGFAADLLTRKKEAPVQPAAYPRLAQDLQGQLQEAMSPAFPFSFDQAGQEPFAGGAGVSLVAPSASKTPSATDGLRSGLAAPTPVLPRSFPTGGPTFTGPVTTPVLVATPAPTPTPKTDVKQLVAERQRQIRQGERVGPLAALYALDEVRPIGIIGSGARNRVWLYSPDTNQRFTVQRGEAFRDGTLEAVNSEGVVFRQDNGKLITARWMKNSEMPGDKTEADAPLLRVKDPPAAPRLPEVDEAAATIPAPSPTPNQ